MTPPSPPDINLKSVSGYVIWIMTSGINKLCYLNAVHIVKKYHCAGEVSGASQCCCMDLFIFKDAQSNLFSSGAASSTQGTALPSPNLKSVYLTA